MPRNGVILMNIKQKQTLASKTANIIINLILKLSDEDIIRLTDLLCEELRKRGIEYVRGCSGFYD